MEFRIAPATERDLSLVLKLVKDRYNVVGGTDDADAAAKLNQRPALPRRQA